MHRDTIRIKSEREEWRQRYESLRLRGETPRPGVLEDERFRAAYAAGVAVAGEDPGWEWRVRMGLWAAEQSLSAAGDFVVWGVERGLMSRAIVEYLEWGKVPKTFFLVGAADEPNGEATKKIKLGRHAGMDFSAVCRSFDSFQNVRCVRETSPAALEEIAPGPIAYLSINFNEVTSERAAGEKLWSRLAQGGAVLLNDYAVPGHEPQMRAWDEFAQRHGAPVLPLPTGQGLVLKR